MSAYWPDDDELAARQLAYEHRQARRGLQTTLRRNREIRRHVLALLTMGAAGYGLAWLFSVLILWGQGG